MDYLDIIVSATSMMEDLKSEPSIANLNTSIYLFREVLTERTSTHPLHFDAVNNLAFALSVRYMYTNQKDDIDEALELYGNIEDTWSPNVKATTNVSL